MPKAIKKCRVCGKDYEACHTAKSTTTSFRWQDVACSPECGATYLAQIRASRKKEVLVDNNQDASEDANVYETATEEVVAADAEQTKQVLSEAHFYHRGKNKKRNK